MNRIFVNGLYFWQFENLGRAEGIRHYVSDRDSGSSGDFTLSLSSSEDKAMVRTNRSRVASSLGVSAKNIFFPSQVHESKIVLVHAGTTTEELQNTDALITQEKGICVSTMSADCVTILLYDSKNAAVAAVHSGWRGTVAKILAKTLSRLKHEFGSVGEDIVAGIGPSVCQDSYEVGEEVIDAVNTSFGPQSGLVQTLPGGKGKLDLWAANKIQLLEFGVPEENIEVSNLCTVKQNNYFYSARKGDKGRFAAGITLV